MPPSSAAFETRVTSHPWRGHAFGRHHLRPFCRVLLKEEQSRLRREPEQPSGHGFSTVPSSGRLPKGGTHSAEVVASVGAAETVEVSPILRRACGLVNNLLHEASAAQTARRGALLLLRGTPH